MKRVAIYTRLSLDTNGEQTATARQERACRDLAQSREWTVVEVFEDVDVSAYQRGITRPAYERLRERVIERGVEGVVVWKLDRLVRRPSEFERFWAACERSGVFLASVTEPIDSSTDIGLAIVRVLVTFAGLESSTIGVRLRSKFREMAEAGRPAGGTRPFGHSKDWQTVVPEEADAIRDAAGRVLRGETLSSIARDWAASGIRTTGGKTWTPHLLLRMLTSARMVGDRSWHGEEIVATDCFAPILDRLTHLRLRRLAASRLAGRRVTKSQRLLTGLLFCRECGHVLHSRHNNPVALYSCPAAPTGCGHVHVAQVLIDEWVTTSVFDWLKAHPPPRPLYKRTVDAATYRELVERLEVLHHDFYVEREIDRVTYLDCRSDLDARLGDLAAEANLPAVEGLHRGFDLRYTKLAWSTFTVPQRRAIIASQIAHVTVGRVARRGGNRFDPERLEIRWREARQNPPPALIRGIGRGGPGRNDRLSAGHSAANRAGL